MSDDLTLRVQRTTRVQATWQFRFTNAPQVSRETAIIEACISEAPEIEKEGRTVPLKSTADYEMPAALKV